MNKEHSKQKSKKTLKTIEPFTLTEVGVEGFKCFREEGSIEIRPITILAGANSSGKSSVMQPLLLLKQTLLDQADPGALKLDGPNVTYSNFMQLIWGGATTNTSVEYKVRLKSNIDTEIKEVFYSSNSRIDIKELAYTAKGRTQVISKGMTESEILRILNSSKMSNIIKHSPVFKDFDWQVVQNRCMLKIAPSLKRGNEFLENFLFGYEDSRLSPFREFEKTIRSIIHLPGLRGNPERSYRKLAIGSSFPGWFQDYAASVIYSLVEAGIDEKPKKQFLDLLRGLSDLGLASEIAANISGGDSTKIELRVSRHLAKSSNKKDLVNIVDVGLGVSQIVPLLVALAIAEPSQIVYVEQPEIHLHPNAQFELAKVLVAAANKGVRIIIETHSDLLLLGIQFYVASGKLDPKKVKLHWFKRDSEGASSIDSRDLKDDGTFGDWPVDFNSVRLEKQLAFLKTTMNSTNAHE